MEPIKIDGLIWITLPNDLIIGKGRALLLERIDAKGSITEASKTLNIPYKKAWQMVEQMNQSARENLVEKNVGGKHGGKSTLTQEGKKVLEAYRKVQQAFEEFQEIKI